MCYCSLTLFTCKKVFLIYNAAVLKEIKDPSAYILCTFHNLFMDRIIIILITLSAKASQSILIDSNTFGVWPTKWLSFTVHVIICVILFLSRCAPGILPAPLPECWPQGHRRGRRSAPEPGRTQHLYRPWTCTSCVYHDIVRLCYLHIVSNSVGPSEMTFSLTDCWKLCNIITHNIIGANLKIRIVCVSLTAHTCNVSHKMLSSFYWNYAISSVLLVS